MTELDALQACLAAEHAACYGYGVLGGVLQRVAPGGADQARADAFYVDHRSARDALTELILGLDADPVAAEPAYATPFAIRSADSARRLARLLEDGSASAYAYAVSQTTDDLRETAARALSRAAVRSQQWGTGVRAFPGADDL